MSSTTRPTHHEAPTAGVRHHANAHGEPWQLQSTAIGHIRVVLSPDWHNAERAMVGAFNGVVQRDICLICEHVEVACRGARLVHKRQTRPKATSMLQLANSTPKNSFRNSTNGLNKKVSVPALPDKQRIQALLSNWQPQIRGTPTRDTELECSLARRRMV